MPDSPPHDNEAEDILAGIALLWPDDLRLVLPIVGGEDFYDAGLGRVFTILSEAHERGEPLDAASAVRAVVEAKVYPDPSIAKDILLRVQDAVPTGAGAVKYAERVKELAVCREIVRLATGVDAAARNGEGLSGALKRLREGTDDIERKAASGKGSYDEWTAPSLLESTFPRPEPLVGENLLDQGGFSMFTGKGGLGKSNLALALGIDLAIGGREWLGHALPKAPVPVLYLWGEGGNYFARERLEMLREWAAYAKQFHIVVPKAYSPDLRTSEGAAELKALIEKTHAKMTFIDHLSEFTGDMDDSDNASCKGFLNIVTGIRRATLSHICILHHNRKPGEGSQKGDMSEVRGASSLPNAADSVLMLDEEPGERIRISWAKAKNTRKPKPLIAKFDPSTGRFTTESTVSEAASTPSAILEAIFASRGDPMTLQRIASACSISTKTATRHLKKMADTGKVIEVPGIGFPSTFRLPDPT